ncbi:ethanolamine ammonia-lyase subunit EutC [Denitratisoma sp. agr-D3]
MSTPPSLIRDPWQQLRAFTQARIALGRSGVSLPTAEVLRFGLAHAQARDAVHQPLDVTVMQARFHEAGFATLAVTSQAENRSAYLRRPDWGRRLAQESAALLQANAATLWGDAPKLAFVAADGLSSLACQTHSQALLQALTPYLPEIRESPVVIATQARVALGDEVGQLLGAEMVVVLIGERPGLSSPDSLGVYLTSRPRVGLTDADRNCISNVRPEGLDYPEAARKLAFLIAGARRLGRSGVDLKDDSDSLPPGASAPLLD